MADAPARGESPRREVAEDAGEQLLGETIHGDCFTERARTMAYV
jgi:hypothetical protein